MNEIYLKTPALFSFQECLRFLGRSSDECLFFIENERLRKLFVVGNTFVLIEIFSDRSGELTVSFLNGIPSKKLQKSIKNYIENWFDLSYDLELFYRMAEKDELLSPFVKKFYGLRLIGIPDFF